MRRAINWLELCIMMWVSPKIITPNIWRLIKISPTKLSIWGYPVIFRNTQCTKMSPLFLSVVYYHSISFSSTPSSLALDLWHLQVGNPFFRPPAPLMWWTSSGARAEELGMSIVHFRKWFLIACAFPLYTLQFGHLGRQHAWHWARLKPNAMRWRDLNPRPSGPKPSCSLSPVGKSWNLGAFQKPQLGLTSLEFFIPSSAAVRNHYIHLQISPLRGHRPLRWILNATFETRSVQKRLWRNV